jgi:NitT/TauT family transport system substrate-binding protein
MNSGKKINYATLADNVNWFGLNSDYNGMTGERIYTKMSRAYTELNLTKNVIPWSKVAYTGIIEKILESGEIDNNQDANGTAKTEFSAPTEKLIEAKAVSQKKVTINFPTAGYTLDNQARAIIDREFLDIIRSFASVRIRIVGNTDNTGNYDSNMALSQKRAEAVVNYLVKEYNIDKNRFVVVGNGPKKATADNIQGANENYRTTDLELLNE